MAAFDRAAFARCFSQVIRSSLRMLPGLIAIGVLLVAVVTGLVVATINLAAPALLESIELARYEFALAGQTLWLAALWALVPIAAFLASGLIYLGSTLLLAHSSLTGGRAQLLRVLGLSVRRAGTGLVVVLAVIIGVLPLGYFAIRWAFALPEVWLRGASPLKALRASWRDTRGRVLELYLVLGATILAVLAINAGASLLFSMLPWEHSGVAAQAVFSVLLSPIPALVLVQRWRDAGGSADQDTAGALLGAPGAAAATRGFGTALPAALSLALVMGLVPPPSPAFAEESTPGADAQFQVPATSSEETEEPESETPQAAVAAPEAVVGTESENVAEDDVESAPSGESQAPASATPDSRQGASTPGLAPLSARTLPGMTGFTSTLAPVEVKLYLSNVALTPGGGYYWGLNEPPQVQAYLRQSDAEPMLTGTVTLLASEVGGVPAPIGPPVEIMPSDSLRVGDGFDYYYIEISDFELGIGEHWLSVVYSGDDAHQGDTSPISSVEVGKAWLDPRVTVLTSNDPPTVGDTITVHVEADPNGSLPSGAVNGPFQVRNAENGNVLATGTFVDGVGTAQFVLRDRSVQFVIGGQTENPDYAFGGGGEHVVRGEAGPSTTTLSAQTTAIFGEQIGLVAEVKGPAGINGRGEVRFEVDVPGTGQTFDLGTAAIGTTTLTAGTASKAVCIEAIGEAPNCAGSSGLTLSGDASSIRVRAIFEPEGEEWSVALEASTSAWQTIGLSEAGGVDPSGECRTIDFYNRADGNPQVRGEATAGLGRPQLTSLSNCAKLVDGVHLTGHREGSTITAIARPAGGLEFVEWRRGGQVIGTNPVLVWKIDTDLPEGMNVTLEPVYRPVCVSDAVAITGYGSYLTRVASETERQHIEAFPSPWCRLGDGRGGVAVGTTIRVSVSPQLNPATSENDVIYSAQLGGQPVDWRTSLGGGVRHEFDYTVRQGLGAAVVFGPECRTVEGEAVAVSTGPNCASPGGEGYARGSQVEVELMPDALGELEVLSGWRVDGEPVPGLGADPRPTITVQAGETTAVGYDTVGCYPVEVGVQEARNGLDASTGSRVDISPQPNCGEANDRWLDGTELTLTAVAGSYRGSAPDFAAWSDEPLNNNANPQRTLVVDAPVETRAIFFFEGHCSTVAIEGRFTLADVTIFDTGCGPGRYYDESKLSMPFDGKINGRPFTRQEFAEDLNRFRTSLFSIRLDSTDVATQAIIRQQVSSPAGTSPRWVWNETKPLDCEGVDCWASVRGDVTVRFQECQALDLTVNIRFAGDPDGAVYSPEYFGLEDHPWVTSRSDAKCGEGIEQWWSGYTIPLEPQSPAEGFAFESWGEIESLLRTESVRTCDNRSGCVQDEFYDRSLAHVTLTRERYGHPVEVNFTLSCSTPNLDAEIAIVQPAPNCPGASAADPLYVDGTILQLVGNPKNRSGRDFREFRGGIIEGTEGFYTGVARNFAVIDRSALPGPMGQSVTLQWDERGRFEFPSALAVVMPDTRVWGHYQYPPNNLEKFGGYMANAGKFAVGYIATGIGAVTSLCPPCAGAIAVVTIAEVVARALGGDGVANFFAMLNPTYMLECISRWGFQSLPPVTSTQAGAMDAAKSGAALTGGAMVAGSKAMFTSKAATISKVTSRVKLAGPFVTMGLGLASAEFYNFDFTASSKKDLRDTAAFLQCLTNTYRT